jgi:type I restriction enzyme S subunit
VDSNNILVSKLNPRFNRIIYPQNIDLGICSTEFVVWKPKYDHILEYLFVLAKTRKFVKYTSQLASGTSNSHKRIKPDLMLNYSLNFNLEIIKEFNELVKPFITKLNNLTRQNKILKETREITINSIL